jgi:hypothetical protein
MIPPLPPKGERNEVRAFEKRKHPEGKVFIDALNNTDKSINYFGNPTEFIIVERGGFPNSEEHIGG